MRNFQFAARTLVINPVRATCVYAQRSSLPPTPVVPHDRRRSVGGAARPDVVAVGAGAGGGQRGREEDGYREREAGGCGVGTGWSRSHACLTPQRAQARPPTLRPAGQTLQGPRSSVPVQPVARRARPAPQGPPSSAAVQRAARGALPALQGPPPRPPCSERPAGHVGRCTLAPTSSAVRHTTRRAGRRRARGPAQSAGKANGSSSATSASFGPVASRSETMISSPASGHCTPTCGSS